MNLRLRGRLAAVVGHRNADLLPVAEIVRMAHLRLSFNMGRDACVRLLGVTLREDQGVRG